MRKIFTLLTMCLLASAAWGQKTVTFIPEETKGHNETASGADSMSKDGVTISTTSGGLAAAQYRFAKGSVTTVSTDEGDILSIEFTCTASGTTKYGPGCFAPQDGYSYEENIGTWQGAASSVEFTAETNQVRATKIVVTVGSAGLTAPKITPAAGTYYDPIEVNISCSTPGAKIYYTLNGSNPTTSSTLYSAPFTLNSNTTVKAISTLDGDVSDVVVAEYVFATAQPVANIAAYQQVADGTVVKFTNPVNALAQSQNKRYLYVKDGSGYALIYSECGQTYVNGDVIPAGFVGTKKTYNGEPELANPLSGFQPASGNSPIAPTPIKANQVSHATFANYVSMDGVTFTKDGNNYTLTDSEGNTCPVYFGTMGLSAPSDLDAQYDVIGVVGSYGNDNTVYQLLPTYLKKVGGGGGDEFGWGKMGDTPDNTEVTFELESTVVWQSGRYLYALDESGFGLAYGDLGQTYKHGDIIPAGFSGKKTTYKDEPELAAPLAGFQAATRNVPPTPEKINPGQVDHNHWAHYVVIENAMISEDGKTITVNGASCEMYNQTFNITMPTDLSVPHTIYGVVGKFNAYQILPISFDNAPGDPGVEPEPTPVASINELYNLNNTEKGIFTTPLTTIFQSGPNLYVKDVEGNYSLVYGTVAYNEFINGDFINDAVAKWTTYQNNKQLVPVPETFVKAGHGAAVTPEVMPIEEVSQDMVHWYLGFENVTVTNDGDNIMMADETGSIKLFDKFAVIPENFDFASVNYVEGFLTVYKGELELYPIKLDGGVTPPPYGKKGDVNNDGEVNIADINAMIDIILTGKPIDEGTFWRADVAEDGEIGIADINALISGILSGTM